MTARIAHARGLAGLILLAGTICLLTAMLAERADARPRCAGKKATVVGSNGPDVIKTRKKGAQVIVGGGGNDRIISFRNKDRVCAGDGDDLIFAGTGRDKVLAGAGDDFVDSGPGKDKVSAGDGSDTVAGGPSGDKVDGGGGADRLLGELQDDELFGDAGEDLVEGGHGNDLLHGGSGNDWTRGDSNRDRYFGDGGSDTVSFATATPPGDAGVDGVSVNLRTGSASGDDASERIFGTENVVGSAFDDRLIGRGSGFVRGGLGSDSCSGFDSEDCPGGSPGSPVALISDAGAPDPGLLVFGDGGGDRWTISGAGGGLRITGGDLEAGAGCSGGGGAVLCSGAGPAPAYVLAWGAGGGDAVSIGGGLAATTLIKADGGRDSDTLSGSSRPELLLAGESGADEVHGGGGDDFLFSRAGGSDLLSGGPGADQLVTDDPCGGHVFSGGRGKGDVAGFAWTDAGGIEARLGGRAALRGRSGCDPTSARANNEALEGTRFADVLIGTNRSDLLIGREGNDVLRGRGRRDRCLGGPGKDRLASC